MSAKESAEARRRRKFFEKSRRELQRALPKAVKAAAKNSGWQTKQGTLFREINGWFMEVSAMPWVVEAKTPAKLRSKPMGIDPVFWEIVQLKDNIHRPLSFRAFGAFVCRTPALRNADIPEDTGSPEHIAEQLLSWANKQLRSLNGTQTLEKFVEFIRTHPDQVQREQYLVPLIAGMLLQGKDEEALAICKETKDRSGGRLFSGDGGFLFNRKGKIISFTDLAIEHISDRLSARIIN